MKKLKQIRYYLLIRQCIKALEKETFIQTMEVDYWATEKAANPVADFENAWKMAKGKAALAMRKLAFYRKRRDMMWRGEAMYHEEVRIDSSSR